MDRIRLAELEHEVQRWWVTGSPGHRDRAVIGLGVLADGRPFVARSGRGWSGAWVACDDRQAADAIESWMRRRSAGRWVEASPVES